MMETRPGRSRGDRRKERRRNRPESRPGRVTFKAEQKEPASLGLAVLRSRRNKKSPPDRSGPATSRGRCAERERERSKPEAERSRPKASRRSPSPCGLETSSSAVPAPGDFPGGCCSGLRGLTACRCPLCSLIVCSPCWCQKCQKCQNRSFWHFWQVIRRGRPGPRAATSAPRSSSATRPVASRRCASAPCACW